MRLQLCAAWVFIVLGASNAFAGRLFGDVKIGGKPAPEGTLIVLDIAGKAAGEDKGPPVPPDSVKTDKVGSFKVVAKTEGKYTLTVHVGKQSAALEVFSYKEPTRYDLLVEEKDGKLTVRRK